MTTSELKELLDTYDGDIEIVVRDEHGEDRQILNINPPPDDDRVIERAFIVLD